MCIFCFSTINIFRIWARLLCTPTQTLSDELRKSTWTKARPFFLVSLVFSAVPLLSGLMFGVAEPSDQIFIVLLGSTLMRAVMSIFLSTILFFVIMRISGGKGTLVQTFHLKIIFESLLVVVGSLFFWVSLPLELNEHFFLLTHLFMILVAV